MALSCHADFTSATLHPDDPNTDEKHASVTVEGDKITNYKLLCAKSLPYSQILKGDEANRAIEGNNITFLLKKQAAKNVA